MSYDLRIAVKVRGCAKFAEIAEPEYSSPTYNLGEMFRACTGWDFEPGEYYRCSDVIGNIERGIKELRTNKAQYKQYEPENCWGRLPAQWLHSKICGIASMSRQRKFRWIACM